MDRKRLYLLYDYGEDGPERLAATLDVTLLPKLAEQQWPEEFDISDRATISKPWADNVAEQAAKYGTTKLTCKMVIERWIQDGCPEEIPNMSFGWGGPTLRVVILDEWSSS